MKLKKETLKNYLFKESFLFIVGGIVYYLIEILARGYSHWSMFLLGGLCFIIIGLLNEFYEWETPFHYQCLIGAVIITVLEFLTGLLVNLQLGWDIWDYSDEPFNFMGQICLSHSFYWIFLSGFAIIVDDTIRHVVFKEEKPRYIFKKERYW